MSASFLFRSPFSLKSIAVGSLISAITTAILFTLSLWAGLDTYELKSLDFFQKLNSPLDDPGVVMVEIDQKSLTTLSDQGIYWPWPRQMYVPMIEVCTRAGAQGILFDVIFSEPSSYGREDDSAFGQSIQDGHNVILPISMSEGDEHKTDIASIRRFGIRNDTPDLLFREARSYVPPVDVLTAGVRALGNVMIAPDRDGVYRRMALFSRYNGYLFPSLAVALFKDRFALRGGDVLFDGHPLPVNKRGELLLHFYGREFRFPRVTITETIAAYQQPESGFFEDVANQVKDCVVIVALTAPGLHDLKPTSVTPRSPGAYVHGTLLVNLLHGHYIRPIAGSWRLVIIFLLGTLLGLLVITIFSFWMNTLVFLCFVIGWPLVSFCSFYYAQRWMGLLPYEIGFFMVFGLSATYSYYAEGKKRRMIRQVFSRYMSEALVRELESHPERAKLGGERQHITIFFSDLANFTGLCEQSPPESIVGLLNEYFTEMSEIILDAKGIIDKYQGDGIMAFWGAPVLLQDHASMACLAALRCQENMGSINRRREKEGLSPLKMRIGLHSGEAIVGNMGSARRFDYTVIGDNVNVASRLEGLNKPFGTDIIISETTREQAGERIVARELDLIAVKGRERPIRIFQLLGKKGEIEENDERVKMLFEEGLGLYRMRRFEEAQARFEQAVQINPGDQPARVFVRRCQNLRATPPPPDWDGVTRTMEK